MDINNNNINNINNNSNSHVNINNGFDQIIFQPQILQVLSF